MKRYCYDCGRPNLQPFTAEYLVCADCAEVVAPHERIGPALALLRRIGHYFGRSYTQDQGGQR